MQNHNVRARLITNTQGTRQNIVLYITTEQESTDFTMQTRWSGVQTTDDQDYGFTIYRRSYRKLRA